MPTNPPNPLPCGCKMLNYFELDDQGMNMTQRVGIDFCPLHSAAPDLLKALEDVLRHVEDEATPRVGSQCTLCFSYRAMIRAAIAKARPAKNAEAIVSNKS